MADLLLFFGVATLALLLFFLSPYEFGFGEEED